MILTVSQIPMGLDAIERMLYKESGLLGVSGVSDDMRAMLERAEAGVGRRRLAVDLDAGRSAIDTLRLAREAGEARP